MKVAVLGAGIQGCCIALLLAKDNHDITLIDQCNDIMCRASVNQEGKIHMGFVYSMDRTFETCKKMLYDALYFSYTIEYLLDKSLDWNKIKSKKFQYLVPHDSLLSETELESCFNKLQSLYTKIIKDNPHLSYLGEKPKKIFHKISINNPNFKASFQTEEVAISKDILKSHIKTALQEKNNIKMLFNSRIEIIKKKEGKYCVDRYGEYDAIYNCLWENKVKFDKQLGLQTSETNNIRLKFGILSEPIQELESLPSYTIVNGPFGDFVNHINKFYFSWYPESMIGMIVNKEVPEEWEQICNGEIPKDISDRLLKTHVEKFQQLFETKFAFQSPKIIPGYIVANGDEKDIHDPSSQLHSRTDESSYVDGYYTIATNKFTSAPRNALKLAFGRSPDGSPLLGRKASVACGGGTPHKAPNLPLRLPKRATEDALAHPF